MTQKLIDARDITGEKAPKIVWKDSKVFSKRKNTYYKRKIGSLKRLYSRNGF